MFVFLFSGADEIKRSKGTSLLNCLPIRHKSKRSAKASTDLSTSDKSRATAEYGDGGSPTVDTALSGEAKVVTDTTELNRGFVEF